METTTILLIVFLVYAIIILAIIVSVVYIVYQKRKYTPRIYAQLEDLFHRHNKLSIGMSETRMLQTMNFRYDRTCEEGKTTYRYVFVTRGGSGSSYGTIQNVSGNIRGYSSGYSEQHDESSVTVECKDNRVIKIAPYNMNNINIPKNYFALQKFANDLGVKYRD